jgi:hypothetical protein
MAKRPTKPKIIVPQEVWGARSGIQKGIRRGDLDLVKTCFDLIWNCADLSHRQWLKWRLTILVAEEALHYTGELAKFWAETKKVEKGTIEEERLYRSFLYRLAIITKSKDADGIIQLVGEESSSDELVAAREIVTRINGGEPPDDVASDLKEDYDKLGLTPYELSALSVLRARSGMGGMLGDRILCCTSMMLIALRRLPETVVEMCEEQVQAYLETADKPKTIPVPWYCYDMHTRAGKIALSAFMKNKSGAYPGLTQEKFASIWFMMESGYVPTELYPVPKKGESPKIWENFWWTKCLSRLGWGNMIATKVMDLWKTSMRDEIKKSVEWALTLENKKSATPAVPAVPRQVSLFL